MLLQARMPSGTRGFIFLEKVHNHPGEKWLGNTTIVSTDTEVAITVLLERMTVLSKANRSISFIPKFKHENRTKR